MAAAENTRTGRRNMKQRGTPWKTVVAQNYSQRDYGDEDEEAFRRMLEMEGV